jgi:ketosteroid isomerase-like protein
MLLLTGLLLGLGTATAGVEAPSGASILRTLLEQRSAAVVSRDLAAIEGFYANDDTLVAFRPGGSIYRGWAAYRKYWEAALPHVPDGFEIDWHDDITAFEADDLIAGHLTWSTEGGGSTRQEGRLTIVLRKRGERWVIVHEHLSTAPPPEAAR